MTLVTQSDIDEYYRKKAERKLKHSKANREWYLKNRELVLERSRERNRLYYHEHKQEIKEKRLKKCLKQNQVAGIGAAPTPTSGEYPKSNG